MGVETILSLGRVPVLESSHSFRGEEIEACCVRYSTGIGVDMAFSTSADDPHFFFFVRNRHRRVLETTEGVLASQFYFTIFCMLMSLFFLGGNPVTSRASVEK